MPTTSAWRGETTSLGPRRAVVASVFDLGEEPEEHLGQPAYAYFAVYRAFAPLLSRLGTLVEVKRPESELDYALWRACRDQNEAVSLSFLPFQAAYLSRHAPNVIYPLWEYPDIPNVDFAGNPRDNWTQLASRVSLILAANSHTARAFERAGTASHVQVVPVPVRPEFFAVRPWAPDNCIRVDCSAVVFPQSEVSKAATSDVWQPRTLERATLKASVRAGLRRTYQRYLRPRMPKSVDRHLTLLVRRLKELARRPNAERKIVLPYRISPTVEFSGIVYTVILNPFDPRENWNDLLCAYLLALGHQEDATLVIKPAFAPSNATESLCHLIESYLRLGVPHRCKVAFLMDALSDEQMLALAQGTTYYLTASRAKRACLALQNLFAAGRPAVGPSHTAFSDCLSEDRGFVVESHPEPAYWPNDPERRFVTTWQRIVWQSLHDRIQESYRVAKHSFGEYHSRATCARQRIADWASTERVEATLSGALARVTVATGKGVLGADFRPHVRPDANRDMVRRKGVA
jgi:hypothetical protein